MARCSEYTLAPVKHVIRIESVVPVKSEHHNYGPKRRWLQAVGGVLAVALCMVLVLLLSFAYWRAAIEEQVVAHFSSKAPATIIEVDERPCWLNRVYEILRIRKPVTGLHLKGSQISDRDLTKLKSLRNLECLSVDQCPISDQGVKEIAGLQTLTSLDFFYCQNITDRSLRYLGTMKSLDGLVITGGRITGHNLQCLDGLMNLEVLDLFSCDGISDDAVESLASLTHLVELDIRGTSISEKGARRICRALPDTTVFTDYLDGEFTKKEGVADKEAVNNARDSSQ